MSSNAAFVVQFIAKCAQEEKNPIETATSEIKRIDDILHNAEVLKLERLKLMDVLDHFDENPFRGKRSSQTPRSEDIDVQDPAFQELRDKIKIAIGNGPVSIRDIINRIGVINQDALIIRTVKLLGDQEIVQRDDDGQIMPGPNW